MRKLCYGEWFLLVMLACVLGLTLYVTGKAIVMGAGLGVLAFVVFLGLLISAISSMHRADDRRFREYKDEQYAKRVKELEDSGFNVS